MGQQTISVDFDGVIHAYSKGWHDGTCYDYPINGAIDGIKKLQKKGYKVVVSTARENLKDVVEWLSYRFENPPEVTNQKPRAIAYIDDRAIRFTNWKDVLNYF